MTANEVFPETAVKSTGTFKNSNGEEFLIRGVSPLTMEKIKDAVNAEFNVPEIPTYEVETATGEKETHQHDKTTLTVEGNPEQTLINKTKWAEHEKILAKAEAEFQIRLMRVVLLSVKVSPTQEWRDEMAFLGIKLPVINSPEERYLYIETRVIQSAEDLTKLMTCVFRTAGMISKEAISEVDATFQRSMEEAFAEADKRRSKKERVDS